ncbi:hypothetical protein [Saccharopolyspora pogona]|uniref:hypothetical protein n=1 Tax=Saccharopolyspora pogona TaxID=333966 RepID=UPI0016846102|nr:hypothetical protein [Saccharopolyspora pogona]
MYVSGWVCCTAELADNGVSEAVAGNNSTDCRKRDKSKSHREHAGAESLQHDCRPPQLIFLTGEKLTITESNRDRKHPK